MYIPYGNHEALVHYEDTIKNKVMQNRVFEHVDTNLRDRLVKIFGTKPIAVWGSRDSDSNRSRFEKMQPGDDILIVEGDTIKLLGKIADKTKNSELSRELWKNLKNNGEKGWDLIYFIANPLEIDLSFEAFKELFEYQPNWQLRGFTNISEDRLDSFYKRYDDLYSVLIKVKNNEVLVEKKPEIVEEIEKDKLKAGTVNERAEEEVSDLSDHIKIQYKLLKLGIKTGSRVWIPKNDQARIQKEYSYSDFEETFTAGVDAPTKYIDNIDVVWKEEFRIDAAFEVENTTSIYSGLLRFSDLKIIAPNSNFPLFIVAPTSKKNRLIEQIRRPTFKKLEFAQKVRYLSYETVDDIDSFFENTNIGLNIDILVGRSEVVS